MKKQKNKITKKQKEADFHDLSDSLCSDDDSRYPRVETDRDLLPKERRGTLEANALELNSQLAQIPIEMNSVPTHALPSDNTSLTY